MPRISEPRPGEPIKLTLDSSGKPRYKAVVTATPTGRGAARRQKRATFDSLTEAREWVAATRTGAQTGKVTVRDKTTLRGLADLWLASKARAREGTIKDYSLELRRAIGEHGDRPVQELTTSEMQAWVNSWPATGGIKGGPLSHRSVKTGVQRLRQVLAHGVKLSMIISNPALDLEVPSASLEEESKIQRRRSDATVWSFQQLQAFVREADESQLALGFRLSAAGLRRSEVLGLDWGAVDLDEGVIHIVQARALEKVDKIKAKFSRRTIEIETMVPGTLQLIKELHLRHGRPETNTVSRDREGRPYAGKRTGLLIRGEDGEPYNRDVYSRAFTLISHDAGLPRIKLHAIRHTIATELHDRGVAPATVAGLLGHSLETHLRVYVQTTSTHQHAAATAFAAAWREAAAG